MNHETLIGLLDYHYWARDRMLDAVESLTLDEFQRDLGNSFGSIRDTLVHLVFAEWFWCSRWEGSQPEGQLAADEFETVQDVRERWKAEEARVRGFVAGLGPDGVDRVIEFAHRGRPTSSIFWHMLLQIVNHGSFHRGQVTTMLRQLGAEPPRSQDLIAFYRRRG